MKVTLIKIVFTIAGAWFGPLALQAKLAFPETTVRLKATDSDTTLSATYFFTNSGSEPIDILSVTTSCGCLSALADKKHFAPNESGTITTVYNIGVNEGAITQTVSVLTGEKTENAYILTFKADLPPALKGALPPIEPVKPRSLFWMRQPFEPKIVTVDLGTMQGSKLTVTCDAPQAFRVETEQPAGAKEARIKVTPLSPSVVRGELTVTLETVDGKKASYSVALRSLAAKTSALP